jgi:hypothetical protein
MARPTKNNPEGKQKKFKFTVEAIQRLSEAFSMDATVKEACYYANIAESTFYVNMEQDPKLLEDLNRLREKPILKARSTIMKSLDQPETAKWYLERKKRAEFATRSEFSGTGTDGAIKIDLQDITKASDNEIIKFLQDKILTDKADG